ncbi:MAG: globin [Ilumatobacteraceae bacterium]
MSVPAVALYERVGGMAFFERLIDDFYSQVAHDDVLLALYPEAPDLSGARHRLTLFLAQYWGGPTTYSDERGHPKLRLRHMPFTIGPLQRDRWLEHMSAAVKRCTEGRNDSVADELMGYFVATAEQMRNDTGLPITSPTYPR